jgi:hypothetical protein
MIWTAFLQLISERHEHALTAHELEVILCLMEHPVQSKQELLETYQQRHSPIEEEAFTQRLRTIYRKFNITGRGFVLLCGGLFTQGGCYPYLYAVTLLWSAS